MLMSKLLKTFKVIFCYKKFFSKFSRILVLLPPSPCDYSCKYFEILLRENERESETPGYEAVCINRSFKAFMHTFEHNHIDFVVHLQVKSSRRYLSVQLERCGRVPRLRIETWN